jgi:hypothetical protein
VDWNRCGQAAVATVLTHYRLGPFTAGLSNDEAMDVVGSEFPPDVPFGLGTSAFRARAAFEHYGLAVDHVHSGWFGRDLEEAVVRLRTHLWERQPAMVCLDQGLLGDQAWNAHWAVATALESERVTLTRGRSLAGMSLDHFLRVWQCRHLPYGHNHCALLIRMP